MKVTKKTERLLNKIIIGAFVVSFLIALAIVISNLGIYQCTKLPCNSLDDATTKIRIGGFLLYISWGIFLVSLALRVILGLQKRSKKAKS